MESAPSTRLLVATSLANECWELVLFLRNHGFRVGGARDALHCVNMLRAHAPDALIIDQQLPWGGSDGVVARLREDLREVACPVLVLHNGAAALDCADPVVGTFRRPVSPQALLETLIAKLNVGTSHPIETVGHGGWPGDECTPFNR